MSIFFPIVFVFDDFYLYLCLYVSVFVCGASVLAVPVKSKNTDAYKKKSMKVLNRQDTLEAVAFGVDPRKFRTLSLGERALDESHRFRSRKFVSADARLEQDQKAHRAEALGPDAAKDGLPELDDDVFVVLLSATSDDVRKMSLVPSQLDSVDAVPVSCHNFQPGYLVHVVTLVIPNAHTKFDVHISHFQTSLH
jgi:hypothetical protein